MNTDTLKLLARAGYAARGVVYVIVGALAAEAALGGGGRTTGSKGAIQELMAQPVGQVLVGLVGVGLVGYAVWRLIQGIYDADNHGSDAKGLAIRAGLLGSAVTHSLLAVYAFSLLFGAGGGGSGSGGGGVDSWTATLLSQPFGQWLVGIAGAVVIVVGLAHAIKAWKQKFEKYLAMSPEQLRIGRPVAIFGLVARGAVFVIIGGFLIVAAVQAQPEEARSLAGTLATLQGQPYGRVLLGVVAFGLLSFGIYSIMEAVYRRVETEKVSRPRLGRDTAEQSGRSGEYASGHR